MSGIVGIFYLDGRPVDRTNLQSMVDILAHRGPDGANIWSDGSIGLGHRMLWTTPESLLEKLPMTKGNLTITADARIDNREELIPALGFANYPAEKITDVDLILAAYEKWEEECPKHLLGDFAFAIWDGRKQQLFCARDHFGVKPFYYFLAGQAFIFASEIKAIVNLPNVPRQLNEARIADYLANMMEDKTITAYQDILRLPPAHTMMVSFSGNAQLKSYWALDPSREIVLGSDEEYAEAFREIFTEAVRCRLRSAFPIGSHLSGGLDSSSVTCVARNLLLTSGEKVLHTFSNIFETIPECDERPFIKAVLDQGGCVPHYVHADQTGPLSKWQQVFQFHDEAFVGPNSFLVQGLNLATQQAGVRVVLNGFDGDSTISHGELYFSELAQQEDWVTFEKEALLILQYFKGSPLGILKQYGLWRLADLAQQGHWLKLIKSINEIHQIFQVSRKFLLWQHVVKPLVPNFLREGWKTWQAGSHIDQSHQDLNSTFAQQICLDDRIQALTLFDQPPRTVREEQWRTFNAGLFTLTLELTNIDAAACSIEARHPFMDKRLIEFCLAVPAAQKLQQGWTRIIMRRAMGGLLPEQIQWREGKADMSANFQHGLLNHDRSLLEEIFGTGSGRIEGYVNLEVIRGYWQQLLLGGKINDSCVMSLWRTATLALWLKHAGITP